MKNMETGIIQNIEKCNLCHLSGDGYAYPRIRRGDGLKVMFIGEAPGREESEEHISFVGKSGKELDRWISFLRLRNYYITNVVKHRPTFETNNRKDRPPSMDEISACTNYLEEEIRSENPDLIITLGTSASYALRCHDKNMEHNLNIPISRSIIDHIETPHCYKNTKIRILNLFHPSYILRQYNMPEDSILTKHMHYLEQVYNIIKEMKAGDGQGVWL